MAWPRYGVPRKRYVLTMWRRRQDGISATDIISELLTEAIQDSLGFALLDSTGADILGVK